MALFLAWAEPELVQSQAPVAVGQDASGPFALGLAALVPAQARAFSGAALERQRMVPPGAGQPAVPDAA